MNTTTFEYTSTSISSSHENNDRSTLENAILAFIVGIIGVVAFVGNIIVIICVRVYRRLRVEVGSYFIINLCLADTLTSVIVMSSSFYTALADVRIVDNIYCQFVCCMNYTLIIVSMLTLSFIALDRYLAVVHALRYHSLMKSRVASLLVSWSWFQGLCFGLAPVFENWIRYDYWEIVCAIRWVGWAPLIYVIIAFSLCFLMPGGVLAVFYCKIMSVAKVQIQSQNVHLGRLRQEDSIKVRTVKETTSKHTLDGTPTRDKPTDKVNAETTDNEEDIMCTNQNYQVKNDKNYYENQSISHRSIPFSENHDPHRQNGKAVELYDSLNKSTLITPLSISKEETSLTDTNTEPLERHLCLHNNQNITAANGVLQSEPISSQLSLQLSPQLSPSSTIITKPHSKSLPQITILTVLEQTNSQKRRSFSIDSRNTSPNHLQNPRPAVNGTRKALNAPAEKDKNDTTINYSASSKALRSLLIVVLAFFICMTPFSVTKLYKVIRSDTHALPGYVNVLATLAQYCSSAINPLVYGILRKDFQMAFKILLFKVRRPQNTEQSIYTLS